MIVTRFEGTESFLIRYSNDHMKLTYCELKKVLDYIKKLFLEFKK